MQEAFDKKGKSREDKKRAYLTVTTHDAVDRP